MPTICKAILEIPEGVSALSVGYQHLTAQMVVRVIQSALMYQRVRSDMQL